MDGESQLGRDETRRPMVQRASGAHAPKPSTLLEELSQRINDCRQRVLDCAARTRLHADSILGERPETAEDRASRTIPHHGGALGLAFHELSSLEDAVAALEEQTPRLSGVA